jgi:PAS domain S-box-containing protein
MSLEFFRVDMIAPTTAHPEHARNARLFTLLLLAIAILGFITIILPGFLGAGEAWRDDSAYVYLVVIIFSSVLYLINQRYSYRLAAVLLIALLISAITASSFPSIDLWQLNTLNFLVLPVLVSSAFLSLRAALLTMLICQAMPLLVATQISEDVPLLQILAAPFSFVLIVNSLIVVVAHHRDRLERERQKQIAENERMLRLITENIEEAILFVDGNGIIQYASPSHTALMGSPQPQLKGLPVYSDSFISRTHPNDQGVLIEFIQAASKPNPSRLNTRVRHDDGHYLWLETNINPLHDENGKPMGVIVVSRDITARKQTEEALRGSEAEARRLFAHNPLPMWVYDMETLHFLDVNDAAILNYGYSREEFLAMTIKDIRPAEDVSELVNVVHDPNNLFVYPGAWRHRMKDGTLIDVEVTAHLIEYNQRPASLVIAQDVTARKQAEIANRERETMAIALAKERELGEIRSLFMRTVSHEFRTPLATIMTATDMLDTYAHRLSLERRAESADTIRREIKRLEQMLRDMMDILRIQDQHLALDPKPLDLEQFFYELINDFRRTAPEHPIDVDIHVAESGVRGDERLLRYIVGNLVSNAIKYSPPNRPIGVKVEQNSGSLHLKVRDQGIGIKPEEQQRLFEPFYRGSNVNEISGTGLGLKIVHDCVHLYQGSIAVESEVGFGTTFTVTLPLL